MSSLRILIVGCDDKKEKISSKISNGSTISYLHHIKRKDQDIFGKAVYCAFNKEVELVVIDESVESYESIGHHIALKGTPVFYFSPESLEISPIYIEAKRLLNELKLPETIKI